MKIPKVFQESIVKEGTVFFIGGIIANFLNYLYRILMGRMLGPEMFGELVPLISLALILAVPASPVQVAAAKFSADFEASGARDKLKNLFGYLNKVFFLIAFSLTTLIIVFARPVQIFLKLSSISYVYFLAAIVGLTFLISPPRGILQGQKKFSQLTLSVLVESASRVILGILFVVVGFKVSGALGAFLCSLFLGYLFALYLSRRSDNLTSANPKDIPFKIREIWRYIFYSFFAFLLLNILINLDKILVKHYFSDFQSGIYSAFSSLGQISFLAVSLLAGIMFPLVVSQVKKREDYFFSLKKILIISFLLIIIISLFLFAFAKGLISVFFGEAYFAAAGSLGFYGLAMSLVGLIFLLSYFFMALDKFNFLFILGGGSLLEWLFISFYHHSFFQVILMFSLALSSTLLGFCFLLFRENLWRRKSVETRVPQNRASDSCGNSGSAKLYDIRNL